VRKAIRFLLAVQSRVQGALVHLGERCAAPGAGPKLMANGANIVMIVIKAILITAAILFLGKFFGLHVREAGGSMARDGPSPGRR
jgi:hypothetical protein